MALSQRDSGHPESWTTPTSSASLHGSQSQWVTQKQFSLKNEHVELRIPSLAHGKVCVQRPPERQVWGLLDAGAFDCLFCLNFIYIFKADNIFTRKKIWKLHKWKYFHFPVLSPATLSLPQRQLTLQIFCSFTKIFYLCTSRYICLFSLFCFFAHLVA